MEGKGSTAEGLNAVSCYRTKVRPPPSRFDCEILNNLRT